VPQRRREHVFKHVVEACVKILPGMGSDRPWELAHQIDPIKKKIIINQARRGVWCGQQEKQAELLPQPTRRRVASPWATTGAGLRQSQLSVGTLWATGWAGGDDGSPTATTWEGLDSAA